MELRRIIILAPLTLVLGACAPKVPMTAEGSADRYAECSFIQGRLAAELKAVPPKDDKGEKNLKEGSDFLMNLSMANFSKATEASSKEEAARKVGEYAKIYGGIFRSNPKAYPDVLLAESKKKCRAN